MEEKKEGSKILGFMGSVAKTVGTFVAVAIGERITVKLKSKVDAKLNEFEKKLEQKRKDKEAKAAQAKVEAVKEIENQETTTKLPTR